ncbi:MULTISPECIES: polysaccharide biosynthesis tyrosine autokinase [Thioalkalivibrio]|uniref:polysaccharide biosynthesis tyrosine autokinase n=1 Tax=Thioalkalivibrio TaxID=106633 RepID=UPI0003628C2D|nr:MULTISPECIES: polysaccharide biosynthesis tyrosine autokinase [Thioalkalivibrio]OOC48934.1 tyrosine-protein kinase [Thioalkalivibrio versutus]
MTQNHSPGGPEGELDIGRLLGQLLDHKWWIVAITVLFAVAGAIHATLSTPIYRADALVQVEDMGRFSSPLANVREMLGQEPRVEAELQILRSRMVLGRAVDQESLDLVVRPHRMPVVGDYLVRRGMERPAFAGSSVWAGESLNVGDFRVARAYEGHTFTLEVLDDNHYRLLGGDRDLGEGRVGADVEFLDGDVRLRVAELEAAPGARFDIQRRSRLAAINGLRAQFDVGQQGRESGVFSLALTDPDPDHARRILNTINQIYLTQNVQRKAAEAEKSLEFLEEKVPDVREQLQTAEDALNDYRMERESVDLSQETRTVLDRLVNLERQLNELEFEEAEISRRYTPSHPTYAALIEKRQKLRSERDRLNEEIGALPETQQQILRLNRDVEVNQDIYVQLLNRMQEMDIARASTVGNVRILDDAQAGLSAVEPQRRMIVMLSTVFGGGLAIALVLVRGMLTRGVESQEEIEGIDLPVYASVPRSRQQENLLRRVKRRRQPRGYDVPGGVLASLDPADDAIEALRGLRSSLHFAMLEAGDNRLVITGPSPDVGKSFVSVNLAAVCAQAGQRVLVIDADLRKGHVHHAFGQRSDGGLSEYLADRESLDGILRGTEIDGLHYIARGSAPPNPSELLMGDRFSRLLEQVSRDYDLVLIDTPPILAVTDAAVVARQCSTTLMVVRFQLNPLREIESARRRLEAAGVDVRGCILNSIEYKASTSYGYGYYHYSYK